MITATEELELNYKAWIETLPITRQSKDNLLAGIWRKRGVTSSGIYDHNFLVAHLYPVIKHVAPQLMVPNADMSSCDAGVLSAPYGEYTAGESGGVTCIELPFGYLSVITGPGEEANKILYDLLTLPFHMVQRFIPYGHTLALKGALDFAPYLLGDKNEAV